VSRRDNALEALAGAQKMLGGHAMWIFTKNAKFPEKITIG